ncbi:radical SAM protein [Rhizobium leguminosarum]|uniref:radical SAM protein n=1 Tax=Rhizobium leguminosarum TaxID=384 RepID=UPI0028F434C3|nr:radical SAM protein [Rhizobium leguminosarum]
MAARTNGSRTHHRNIPMANDCVERLAKASASWPAKLSSPRTLVLQAAAFCNISCSYCYLSTTHQRGIQSKDVLEAVAARIVSNLEGDCTVLWQSGEPLVAPISYYRYATDLFETCKPSNVNLKYSLQTNATLVTKEVAAALKELDIVVGVSLDGPKDIHDFNRKTRQGYGTHEKAIQGLDLLSNAGVRPYVFCVLTKNSLSRCQELFDYFELLGIRHLSFFPEEIAGKNKTWDQADESLFAEFFAEYLHHIISSRSLQTVTEFTSVIRGKYLPSPFKANAMTIPGGTMTVSLHGELCTFGPELRDDPQYPRSIVLGNVCDPSLFSTIDTAAFRNLCEEIGRGVAICEANCEYYAACGGGNPSWKFGEFGRFDVSETHSCRTRFKAVDAALKRVLDQPNHIKPFLTSAGLNR